MFMTDDKMSDSSSQPINKVLYTLLKGKKLTMSQVTKWENHNIVNVFYLVDRNAKEKRQMIKGTKLYEQNLRKKFK